jgi:hypothetical protein
MALCRAFAASLCPAAGSANAIGALGAAMWAMPVLTVGGKLLLWPR